MSTIEATLRRATEDLDRLGKQWALVGGLAVSVRAEPRTTRDIDLAVSVSGDAETEATVLALQGAGYRVSTVVEHDARGRLATVRLVPPGGTPHGVLVDLLFASSGIEAEVAAAAEPMRIVPGLEARVARVGHLVALKILARDDRERPQDLDDLRALLREATSVDLEEARAALRLIEERGYERGRRLGVDLEELLRSS